MAIRRTQNYFLFMRLTALLLLTICLHFSTVGVAQKVTLSEQNASLKKIFKEIKSQTGYVFFYNASLLERSHPVSISVKNEELSVVLQECFRDQPLSYNIVNKTVVVSARKESALSQPAVMGTDSTPDLVTITGKILDDVTKQ